MKLPDNVLIGALLESFSGTVYTDGGFDYRLWPESDSPTTLRESQEYLDAGLPERGYVSADGDVTAEQGDKR